MSGQALDRAFEFDIAAGFLIGRLPPVVRRLLAALSAGSASSEVDGTPANRLEHEGILRLVACGTPPDFHQHVLDHVLRIGFATRLGAGEEQIPGCFGLQPSVPITGSSVRRIH